MESNGISRLQKDRKILRKIDAGLASQSRFIILANTLFYLLITYVGGFYFRHPVMTMGLGAGLLVLAGLNLLLTLRFEPMYGAGPARWRSLFLFNQIAVALFIGAFAAAIILVDELSITAFLAILYVVGFASLNNVEWSPYLKCNIARHIATCIPSIAACVVIADINGGVIALFLFIVWILLIRQSRLMFARYWQNIKVNHELQYKARDLAQAVNQANDASRFKSEFLSSFTHEIRTPMNNVLGVLALLDDTELSPQQRELQEVAVNSGEALLSLIEDIMDFSKINSGQIQLLENVFNLKRCVDHAVELMGPRAHDKGIELSCNYGLELPVRVKGDEGRLVQLIHNLVSNAIKYSDGNDILVKVDSIKYSQREAEIKVTVKDNGKGVDPAIQNHIFDAFSKQSKISPTNEVGTGLGLAISRGLARVMGGDVGFVSHPGLGSEFWFTARLHISTQQAQKQSRMQSLADKKALIIGAAGNIAESLDQFLAEWNFSLDRCSEADLRQKIAQNEESIKQYDVVFINLPITQKLNVQALSHLIDVVQPWVGNIIVLSSLAQRADAMRLGIEDKLSTYWMSKPATGEKVQRIISSLFSLHPLVEIEHTVRGGEQAHDSVAGVQVLLVEDNAVNQMVARSMLAKLGYGVTCASNGKEALGLLEEKSFDLILMDCLMPVLDGYETTIAWRQMEESGDHHIPIIAMTASVVEGEQQRCLVAGMDDYLSKPVNLEELNAKIRQWLGDGKDQAKSDLKTA